MSTAAGIRTQQPMFGGPKLPQKPNGPKDPNRSKSAGPKNKYKAEAQSSNTGTHHAQRKNNGGNIDERLQAVPDEEEAYNNRNARQGISKFCAYSKHQPARGLMEADNRSSYAHKAGIRQGLVQAQQRKNQQWQPPSGSRFQLLSESPMDI